MARDISLAFALGARLQSGFSAAFRSASRQAQLVSQSIREMEQTPTGRIGAVMAAQRERLRGLSGSLREARGDLARLRQQAAESGSASALLTRQIAQAERRVDGLSASLRRQGAAWRETVAQAATAGGSVRELTRNYEQLSQRLERARALQAGLAANRTQAEALRSQREDLRGRLVGTALTGAAVALPVKLAVSAEDTFADLRKVMDAPESVMQQVFADAQEMSNRTGKSFEDVVTIMTAAAQAGLGTTREQLLGVADQAVKMSIAWGVSAEQAGKSLATWQASMGMTDEQSKHTADVINALSNAMNAEAGEIDQIFTRMGPLMKASGFAAQDIAALATAFKAAGAEVEVSGTAMKNFVNVLAAGASGLTDARKSIYKYLQIDPNTLQKQLQTDAMGAVMRVLEALRRVRPEERNSIMGQLFGQESLAAIAPLMSEYKTLRKAHKIANGDVSGSVEQEYANRMKTTATSLARLKQSTRNLGVTAGTALLPVVGAVASRLTGIVNGARELTRRFPRLSATVMTGAAAVASLAVGGVALGLVMNAVRTAGNGLCGALIRLGGGQVLAANGTRALTFWQRMAALASLSWRDVLTGLGGGISRLGQGLAALIGWQRGAALSTILFSAVQRAGTIALTIFSGGLKLVGVALRFATGPLGVVLMLIAGAAGLIIDNWNVVGPYFSALWQGIVGVFEWAWKKISGIIDSVSEGLAFIGKKIDETPILGSAKRGLGKAVDWAFGDDEKPAAPVAAAAAEKPAAPTAAAVAEKPAASVAAAAAGKPAAPDFSESALDAALAAFGASGAADVSSPDTALASFGGKKGVDGTAYFNKSFNDFMAAEEARKKGKSGGSGGRSGSKSGRAASGSGPITVVTLAGDNSRTQTLFIPASSRGTSATPVASATTSPASAVTVAASPARPTTASPARLASAAVLPQTPARLARRAGNAPTGERGGSVQVAVSQKFDILSSDPRAVRKLMDSLKPDFENLVRRALEKLESNRRRTAYAQ